MPRSIGAVISSGLATLHELGTVYSVEDVYTMIEINTIDCHNRKVAAEAAAKERKK